MSSGISIYIIVLTVLNMIGAVALLWWTRRSHGEAEKPGADTTGHVWDGDLREFNNPLPRWWLWLFLISVAFAVGYLVLYPGFGSAAGSLGWTSTGQHAEQAAAAEKLAQQTLAKFDGRGIEELMKDPAARTIGRNLFVNNCAVCHGSDGHGALHFPNLADKDWKWGGDPATVEASIANGRTGVMAPWKDVIGESGVDDAVAYVLSLSKRDAPFGNAAHGGELFKQYCIVCHGDQGQGNPTLGAPNLTDNIWLHGGAPEQIRETIRFGRTGIMPAQQERLGAARVRLLAAYVLGLGE
ncbi:MAG: cytochrome-c oxidase, cbb3-type subunit III [Steroidobacteraceae bacterium]